MDFGRWLDGLTAVRFALNPAFFMSIPLLQGKGQLAMGQRTTTCYICKGEGQWYCADCQATGMISRKKV